MIDPRDFRIEAGTGPNTGSGIGAATLASSLKTSDVEIETQGSGSEPGDIIVNAPVSWADTTLTLRAHRNIEINAGLSVTGSGGLTLEYGQGGRTIANTARYIVNAPVHLAPEAHFRTKLGHDGSTVEYTVITDVDTLQAISETFPATTCWATTSTPAPRRVGTAMSGPAWALSPSATSATATISGVFWTAWAT